MKKIISIIVCFALVFALAGVVDAKRPVKEKTCNTSFIDSLIPEALNEINSNTQYLEFIGNSKYDSFKISIGVKDYYFVYTNNQVVQVDNAEEDFSIKLNCNQMDKIVEAYNNNNPKLKKMILHQIPFKVKANLMKQCMNTEWCKEQIF